ncbi:hypothetical protein NC651_001615 [Populus alba x Populus x berolinensis]|nr:hypothetical protein NC651_001615 [Populus alba x Populus x berolinensis]
MQGIKIENPFTFKVLQVCNGLGFGRGTGIGQGLPTNMVKLLFLSMRATIVSSCGSASKIVLIPQLSFLILHLWKLGAKNIQADVGCGVGFGHGFGTNMPMCYVFRKSIQCLILLRYYHIDDFMYT